MKKTSLQYVLSLFLIIVAAIPLRAQGDPSLYGKWELLPEKSTDIDLYGALSVEVRHSGSDVTLIQTWGSGRTFCDSLALRIGAPAVRRSITNRVFPSNVFMGLSMPEGGTREIKAEWEEEGKILKIVEHFPLRGSQGKTPVTTVHRYELSQEKDLLIYTVDRSTRKTGPRVKYMLKNSGSRQGYFMTLEDNWEIGGKLPVQAFIISLQGIVNAEGPVLNL